MEPDFGGYATKSGLKCSDGRVIMPDAFKHQDETSVPLVWQHVHNNPDNVLGHAYLENREDGVYAYGFFNDTPAGKKAKTLVEHGDVNSLSIYANQLVEKSKQVFHGAIREVSLVLAGANPGARIDFVSLQHSDGDVEVLEDEAVIYSGLSIQHSDDDDVEELDIDDEEEGEVGEVSHADGSGRTVADVYNAMTEEQKAVLHLMVGTAVEEAGVSHDDMEDGMHNVFETDGTAPGYALSHEDVKGIVSDAIKTGSLKEAVEGYALQHGIENIDLLFPDARAITNTPEFDKRRTEWVASVLSGTRHTPFSRIKSLTADLNYDEARAKGYIKGNFKKEEFFGLAKRVTTPTTIYKKQKLDRDDIVDITDFDVVAWLKAEMRMMLEEELARAILIGDGREPDNEDKIRDPAGATEGAGIRAIANEHELYATTIRVNLDDEGSNASELVDTILLNRAQYRGSGTPTFYTTEPVLTRMLMLKDQLGRRLYRSVSELATELRVTDIVPVEVMQGQGDLVGIIVNLSDYTVGADKGGEVSMFDDFDIDYNQYKYLIETRVSGALTKIKSALVIRKAAADQRIATPVKPGFNSKTGEVTVPDSTSVAYYRGDQVLAAGVVKMPAGTSWVIEARPKAGYFFETTENDTWTFKAPAA